MNLNWGGGYTKSEVDTLLNGKSDTGHTHTKSDITDFPTLSTVATSGSYNDLSNKPTIPTVNNATLTIQRNGTTVDTFTANASVDKTINISTTDDTKIPLAGSNQISGDLIPATDNSIDVGSSTKNIKMLYTKGITIDAKTIDTDVNDNMTFNGHIVDTIEEQGEGYIRYSNGLQVCFKQYVASANTATPITLPKPFIDTNYNSSVTSYAGAGPKCSIDSYNTITRTGFSIRNIYGFDLFVDIISIGKWK